MPTYLFDDLWLSKRICYTNVKQKNSLFGAGMKMATHESERIEALDETNMTVTYSVIEGEALNVFKVIKATIKLLPGADANSCRLSWTAEFEPAGNTIPPSEPIKEAATNIFKAVEGYLLTTA